MTIHGVRPKLKKKVALLISACLLLLLGSSYALTSFPYSSSTDSSRVESSDRPVFAYYYGWYTKDAWFGGINGPSSLAVAFTPATGLYDSQNVSVIDTQISEASAAGINGFIASWWGPGSFTDNTDQILINEAASKFPGFVVALYFETEIVQKMNSTYSAEANEIVNDVQYIMSTYGSSPAFATINGREMLFFSGVDNWPIQFWQGVTEEIHQRYPSLLLISDSLDLSFLNVFDGAASYVDLGYMTQSLQLQSGTYPTFADLSSLAHSEGKYWFATASPGFNGTNDGKTQFENVPRGGGETFVIGWDIAQNSQPDGMIVGTWNEYYEGTSIEPTAQYGDLYLQLTAQLASQWRFPISYPCRDVTALHHLFPLAADNELLFP